MTTILKSPYPDAAALAAPRVVQAATGAFANAASAIVTLASAPTPGNVLITIHQLALSDTVNTLAGHTRRSATGSRILHVHTRIVVAGDGTSYTWTAASARNADVTMLEVTGQTTDVPRGLTDAASGTAGTSHSFPFADAPAQSLRIAAVRFNGSSPFTPQATWSIHNNGAAGSSANIVSVTSKASLAPDIGTPMTGTTIASQTPTYTTFAVPGT